VKEYGATRLLLELIPEMNEKLKEVFPSEYMHLLVISALRLVYETPLKDMRFYFEGSYLSETLRGLSIGPKGVSKVLKEAGRQRDRIVEWASVVLSDIQDACGEGPFEEILPEGFTDAP